MKLWCHFWSIYPGMELKNFIFLTKEETLMVLSWRNHPDVASKMFRSSPISFGEHFAFLEELSRSRTKTYYLVLNESHPIGVIYLNPINWPFMEAELGLYRAPDRRGYGALLMKVLEYTAFELLRLKRLIARVKASNYQAIKLYQRFGYVLKEKDQNLWVMIKEV